MRINGEVKKFFKTSYMGGWTKQEGWEILENVIGGWG